MNAATIVAGAAFVIWLYLLLGRGEFWLPRLLPAASAPERWPSVVAIVPARNEAAVVGTAVASLLAQDYRGAFAVVLVDDGSTDGTAAIAQAAAGAAGRVRVVTGRPPPAGWAGKVWAQAEGIRAVEERGDAPDLYLLTDADIAHHSTNLAELVAVLEAERRDLVSLMVKLRCESLAERLLVPAFVFFFAMLYPFAWASDPRRRTAAAAGGCMLLRAAALARVGGLATIKGALIDDCALAATVKRGGAIRLSLSEGTRSLRPYPGFGDVWSMVARTAYTQLDHSPWRLAGTVLGMGLTYLAPPSLVLAGGAAGWLAGGAWAGMALAYLPMLGFYGRSPLWAPLLPAVAAFYVAATLASAYRHRRGRGGEWKGRVEWQSQR